MPVSTRPPPEFDPAFGEIPATAPPPKKKSRLPLFVGGCFGLMLVFGCCGGLAGTGLFGTLMAPDMEDQGVSLPEAPELDPIEVPEIDPTLPDDPGQAGVPELPPGVPDRPEVDLAPDVPPPVSGGMTFQSLAEGTRKVKVSCGGGKASEEGSSVVLELSGDPKCTVTAYLDDRSRITAIVMDASEGNYRCFEGGEQRCER